MSEAVEGQEVQQPGVTPTEPSLQVKSDPAVPPVKGAGTSQPEEIVYEETGDPKLDVALAFFGKAGLDADHPAIKAAVTGDFSLLAAYLESKGIAGWQSHLNLAKESHAKFTADKAAGEQAIVQAVTGALEKAGYTNEQWGEVIQFVRENAEEGEIAAINQMLQNPFTAKIAVGYLTGLHAEATQKEVTPARQAIREDAGQRQGNPAQNTPLTRAQFAQEAEKLAKQYGGSAYMSTPEYRALRARVK